MPSLSKEIHEIEYGFCSSSDVFVHIVINFYLLLYYEHFMFRNVYTCNFYCKSKCFKNTGYLKSQFVELLFTIKE